MRWLVLSLICSVELACALPKTRDCFTEQRSRITFDTPTPPPLVAPPASVADITQLTVIAENLNDPVALAQPAGDDERLFVAERGGRIVILRPGAEPVVFADLSDRVAAAERGQGLLGLAFHPEFLATDKVFVNYTGREDGATYVVEFRVARDSPDRLDLSTARQLMRVGQPWPTNNGGHLAFGPDSLLYIGVGDGGGRDDPRGHAQKCKSWRGKMLRMDVDAAKLAVEVIQVGLRNPWRYSFDRKTGDLYIGDHGQDQWEAVYAILGTNVRGHNFGWPIARGSRCLRGQECERAGFTVPILEYGRGTGCAIVGGYVYRGQALSELDGAYFFSDYCTGLLHSIRWKNQSLSQYWDWRPVVDPQGRLNNVTSLGQDQAGELYILTQQGAVLKLTRK